MTILKSLGLALVLAASAHHAAQATSADATAGAKLIKALAISKTSDLYFGTIVPASTADTVEIDSDGARTCGANLTCIGSDHTAAGFDVQGEPGFSYSVSLPNEISISNGTSQMRVIALTTSLSDTPRLAGDGADSFTVGGTLSVAGGQATGDYAGTFSVTIIYE